MMTYGNYLLNMLSTWFPKPWNNLWLDLVDIIMKSSDVNLYETYPLQGWFINLLQKFVVL
jgi:hypothetical protein